MKQFSQLLFLLSALTVPSLCHATLLMETGFEGEAVGYSMTRDLWTTEGFQPATWDEGLETRTRIVSEEAAQGIRSMRVMYPKNEFGTSNTGCQVPLKFSKREEAYASYFLRFSENFSWGTSNFGGKLPGLSGGGNCSGGKTCDGTNGWSARLMWRSNGKLVLYLYDMLKPGTYGLDVELSYPNGDPVVAERGKWYHIAERVKMNSEPNTADGEVQIWVNGKEVLLLKERQFTTNEDKIDCFYISTFHGGDDDSWCPTDTCYTFFDDIRIGTEYEDVCYQTCSKPQAGANQPLCLSGYAHFNIDMPVGHDIWWTKDGTTIAQGNTFDTETPGQYIVVADSGHCSQNDTVWVTEQIVPKLPAESYICASSFTTLDTQLPETEGISYQWKHDGKPLPQTSSAIKVKDGGTYILTADAPNCQTATDTSIVTTGLLKIADIEGQAGETMQISVTGNGQYLWTDENGEAIGEGPQIEVSLPKGETFVYATDLNGFNGNIGKKQLTSNAYTRNNFEKEYMLFTVERELTIDSISIYPVKALDATINIVDEDSKTTVFSQIYKDLKGGSEARLPIGVTLKAGSYHIDAAGTTAALYHSHTDSDIGFPYAVDGLISIDGCNLAWINDKGWYMLFYNWHVSSGNYCAATPVKLKGNDASHSRTTQNDETTLVQDGNKLLVFGVEHGEFLRIFDLSGKQIFRQEAISNPVVIDINGWAGGIYIVNGKKIRLKGE